MLAHQQELGALGRLVSLLNAQPEADTNEILIAWPEEVEQHKLIELAKKPMASNAQAWQQELLVIAEEERYVMLGNGKMFSTGNHPVEKLLPLHHLMEAGFDVGVATLTGYPVKLEHLAMPGEDEAVQSLTIN